MKKTDNIFCFLLCFALSLSASYDTSVKKELDGIERCLIRTGNAHHPESNDTATAYFAAAANKIFHKNSHTDISKGVEKLLASYAYERLTSSPLLQTKMLNLSDSSSVDDSSSCESSIKEISLDSEMKEQVPLTFNPLEIPLRKIVTQKRDEYYPFIQLYVSSKARREIHQITSDKNWDVVDTHLATEYCVDYTSQFPTLFSPDKQNLIPHTKKVERQAIMVELVEGRKVVTYVSNIPFEKVALKLSKDGKNACVIHSNLTQKDINKIELDTENSTLKEIECISGKKSIKHTFETPVALSRTNFLVLNSVHTTSGQDELEVIVKQLKP